MGSKAPTPAPNRRPDGTIDPDYKKPLATPTLPTREDFVNATALLETLTSDTVVTRLGEGIEMGSRHPFDHHLYSCFVVKDSAQPCDVVTEYLEPAIQELAKAMSGFQMVGVRPLSARPRDLSHLCYDFPDATLPLRFTLSYDMIKQGTMVVVDLFFRLVGDYHRTVINGPLHLAKMPFVHDPPNGSMFDYTHLATPQVYQDSYGDSEEAYPLPGLEPNVSADSRHRYRVNGAYCYYVGETLLKELRPTC
jgi:hypothetical protein